MSKKAHGFTIVELLIVIVVIAVLAAISVVAYNGIQSRAQVAKIQSDLSANAKKVALYYVKEGRYPVNVQEVRDTGIKMSSTATALAIYCGNQNGFAIVSNEKDNRSGRQFKIGSDIPLTEIIPTVSVSSVGMCSATPYPVLLWSDLW